MIQLSSQKIKIYTSLRYKKYREKYGLFITEGEKILKEILKTKIKVESILVSRERKNKLSKEIFQYLAKKHHYIFEVEDKIIQRISPFETPQPILIIGQIPDFPQLKEFNPRDNILLLDHIQDPGNVGTILRTAYYFGIKQIFISPGTADIYNPKVIRASMGAVFYQKNFSYQNEEEIIKWIKKRNYTLILTSLKGNSLPSVKAISSPWCLVLGNESRGVSSTFETYCDWNIKIPAKSDFDSLNVATSSAIFLYHLSFSRELGNE